MVVAWVDVAANSREDEQFNIQALSPGHYRLGGELSFATVNQALRKTAKFFTCPTKMVFDLSEINMADSAGLALLIEWMRQANQARVELHYVNLPSQLQSMAQLVGLDSLLLLDK